MVILAILFGILISTTYSFAGPVAGIGAALGGLGSLGTALSIVSGIASIGSMLGMFGGNDEPSMPSVGGGYVGPAPALPQIAVAEAAPVVQVDQNKVQQELDAKAAEASVAEKRSQVNRASIGKTNLTKGMLAEEEASTKKTTLLGG